MEKFIRRKSDGYIYPYSEALAKMIDMFEVIEQDRESEKVETPKKKVSK